MSFNASTYLLDRHIENGDGDRLALTGVRGELTYAELHDRVRRTAGGLRRAGLRPEQRLLMFMADSPEFVTVFLAAMRIGAVPVPVSTMMRAGGLAALLDDSRAAFLAVSAEFGEPAASVDTTVLGPDDLQALAGGEPDDAIYPTTEDSPAFWLYTSGTTGRPKGAMHRHGSIRVVCETYGHKVLGIRSDDRCLSAAKAFFAYGLGNSLLFPLSVGAAAVLEPAPSKPDVIAERAQKYGATLFFGGPTFFAGMLRSGLAADALAGVRLAASAGEPLPAELYHRWTGHFGVDIIDGIGMTEMLHIFLSNRPGAVRPGTTGVPVPGYDLRILDEAGYPVAAGVPGTLFVRGDSAATGYWCRYATSRQVFQGEWLRTGDTYRQDEDGYYHCLGRTDDVLKVSGMWVAPAEVENRLLAHPSVAQAVVVAAPDADELDKPVAFVIKASPEVTEDELVAFCRDGMESYKRPRRVVFVGEYPTTATGKVRRVELRATAAEVLKG
ncbi:benzoate-CoA ligase family protein [Actinoplanes sp. NPDC051343]|uniref:benzoate-CoA ligase family protein n=1 Tax=Actinoplanes sp. NPDC051343 TaxID=3363906 RepID=UPI003791D0DD